MKTELKIITEGKARILLDKEREWAEVSSKMPVFYNPQMALNRDISILLLNAADKTEMQICDLLAGSGIRSIRFLLELKKGKIKNITINDYDRESYEAIKKNLELNKIKSVYVNVTNKEADLLLIESSGFDYIDIDPFGTPNPFLESSVKRISRNGILAVTATDTSALCGTYENACKRKYWATPLRNELMHEIGVRILIRKVQLIGAHHKKALIPIFSYAGDHYMRIYLRCDKGKTKVDEVLKLHKHFHDTINDIKDVGPLWTGKLWDEKLVKAMLKESDKSKIYSEAGKFIHEISKEAEVDALGVVGFYDLHKVSKLLKIHAPKKELVIGKIRKAGFKVANTHFARNGLKSDIGFEELKKILL